MNKLCKFIASTFVATSFVNAAGYVADPSDVSRSNKNVKYVY